MSDEEIKDKEIEDMTTLLQSYSDMFDALCGKRHEAGAAEYGVFTFLDNDVVRMMAEELADTANYCRMQFIKLMILQSMLEKETDKLKDSEGNITIGVESFRGAKKGWE
jgi:hypothetical protein